MTKTVIPHSFIYIHGFGSSPASWKAQLMKQAIERLPAHQIDLPQLPFSPQSAMTALQQLLQQRIAQKGVEHVTLIGSSLGAYYALYWAERFQLKAILINPAVRPWESLANHLGDNQNYHTGEHFTFYPYHIAELRQYDVEVLESPEKIYLLLQTADEVLDYRQALAKFPNSPLELQQGGSHGFDNFEQMIPSILNFAGISDTAPTE